MREVLIAKKDIEQNIFSKSLEDITLLNNDPFSQEKEEVIDLLKKYQIQSIYKTHSLNPKILKKYFKLTNENDITLDFLLKNEDEVKRIKSQFNNNKLNFINLSSELSDKYEQIKIDFPKDTAFINELDTHFNNLKSNIDKATSSVTFDLSHNFSIKTTYANSSFKIDFTKDENEFNINEMLKTRSIIKNFFNFLFSKVFINITKEKTDNFSLIIWDKTIEDSSFFETYYEDWKNNNFEKSFVSKNNIDFFTQINPQTNKLSFYDEINKIKSEFNETKKLTSVFDEFKEEEEKFFYLAKENLTIDKTLLENIDLDNYFFLDEFKKDLKDAIESKDFNKLKKYNNFDLNNLNSFDELKNKINDVINFLLDNNILLTKNIFNIVNDKFLEFNSINPKVDFINNFLTSANKDKLKELFNVFNLNSKLSYDNLKILQNTTHYQEELETYPLDNTNKAKNLDNKKNITTLINIFPDFEAYFLICGKGYLFFNSELIDQNKFNNFLQNNGNDFDTKDEYKNNYFDFNDPSYPKHLLNNVIKEWNVWSIEKMHTELFLQSDDFLLFYDKMKNLIKIKNDNSSSSFTDNLNLNNNNFKNNLITAAINKLESDWNKFFEEIIKDYPIFNYLDKVNSEKTKKQLEISDKLNSISRNLAPDTFLKEIQEKEQKLALNSQQEKDKWLFIFINELHANLKNDQKITQLINKIPDSILKEIKLELEDYFKLYFLDIEDLKLTDHELQTKYLAKDGSNYVFNNEKNRNQFYENLKIYANFDTYKKNFYYKLLILKDLKEYSKKVLEGNFLDFNEVIEYKNTLKKKYITNNIPLDEEEIIKKIIEDNGKDELFIDNLKLLIEQKTSSFYIFNKNPSLITEIDNNLAISAEEKIIKDIFLNKKSDLLIEKYKENQNLKDNPFSKDNIFKKIEEYKEIGKKTVLISNLDYLRDEINNFIKKQYYKDIYLAQLNKTNLFSKIINDLDDLYQKNQAANSLGNNYKIFFDNKAIDLLSIEHKKLKEETETFLSEKKVTVFYEIADHFYKKYQKIIRDYQGFDINIEENDNHKNVKILFEYFDNNYGRSTFDKKTILQIIENKNLEENLSIFENYLKSIEIKIINVIKGSIYNLLKEIKENSIIFDLGSNFNIKNYTIKSLKWFKLNIPLSLNFELWSNESYVNLKKVYDLLLTNHLIVNRSAYSYTHFTNELNDLKNTYFDYEKEIIEIILKDIVAFYDTLDQHYKGYHYPTKEKFNLNYQKFEDEFNNLSNKKEKIYFLTSYSEKGSAFREFIDDQDKQLLDQKSSIAKKIISENFYGYDFEKNQAGEWWYSKKPAYINEIMDEKIQRGANASDILNKKFLDPVRISDLKELVKTNIVLVDLNKLVKEQSKYFFNYWYQDFNKVIDNPPIDEDKTIELINNHYFNFYAIAKNFYDKINKLEAEQNESFKKYKLIVNKSLGFHKSNSIINVENVEKTRNSLLLVREKENIYSITNSTLLEKYFIIGIDYGFLLVLKTNDLTKDLENCTFSKKVFYDLNNNRSTSLDNTEIQFLDNKIVFSDTKTGKFLNITYNNFFDDIKDISDIEPEDLKVIKNFYQFPKNKKVEIEHNFYLEG
ncbi:hypothetical protein JTY60_02040 [symbiont of Argiope bruennichi]|uniref:hypothetical protein n=1 Tax=symbiont of Argiope bruennichi TaxID=2810479 RepID=UPI003DA6179B